MTLTSIDRLIIMLIILTTAIDW